MLSSSHASELLFSTGRLGHNVSAQTRLPGTGSEPGGIGLKYLRASARKLRDFRCLSVIIHCQICQYELVDPAWSKAQARSAEPKQTSSYFLQGNQAKRQDGSHLLGNAVYLSISILHPALAFSAIINTTTILLLLN